MAKRRSPFEAYADMKRVRHEHGGSEQNDACAEHVVNVDNVTSSTERVNDHDNSWNQINECTLTGSGGNDADAIRAKKCANKT